MKPLGTKNHATSWDKKNHATSRDNKKIMQNSRDKNNTQHLGTKKSSNTSDPKKITQPLRKKYITKPVGTLKISLKIMQFVQIDPNWSKLFQNGLNGSKLDNQVLIGPKGFKCIHRGPKKGVQNYHELNRMAFHPRSPGS